MSTSNFLTNYHEKHYEYHRQHANYPDFSPSQKSNPRSLDPAKNASILSINGKTIGMSSVLLLLLLLVAFYPKSPKEIAQDKNTESMPLTKTVALDQKHSPLGFPNQGEIFHREAYSFGFDLERKLAHWVNYKVQLGKTASRSGNRLDPKIPEHHQRDASFYSKNKDYQKGTFITMSHIGAVGEEASKETFYYSVIAPQTSKLNNSLLRKFDATVKKQAEKTETWVTAGPIFDQPTSEMPTRYFYIYLFRKNPNTWVTASYLFLNSDDLPSKALSTYQTDLAEIKRLSGLDLFQSLPKDAVLVESKP